MSDVHEVAVRAMASAMGRGLMGQTYYREQAKAVLAALNTPEVRAALVAVLAPVFVASSGDNGGIYAVEDARLAADAVLDALVRAES